MEVKTIRQTLKKYLLGHAGEEEVTTVDNWFQSFENDKPLSLPEEELEAAKLEIWEKIATAITIEKKKRVIPLLMKVAASAAIVAGLILTVFLLKNRQAGNTALTYTTVSTKNGERKSLTIKDGTRLTLNAGTTVHVYDDFSAARRVDLVDGEVFFDVQRDPQKPFHIQSNGLTITVLGTSFNVLSYKELNKISIGVVTGKVKVAKDTATLDILQKDQELIYDKDLQTHNTIAMDESLLAWKEGRLLLNDVSFNEMSFLMKKNFGIDVLTENPQITNTKYTTQLFTSMTAEQAVEVLASIHNLKIKVKNNQIYLYK